MNQQPTVILLKFTDYLDNLDSLCFLRLCHSIWFFHHTKAGRYRLKQEIGNFHSHFYAPTPSPSYIPPAFFDDQDFNGRKQFSPAGNILVESLKVSSPEDFTRFKENFSIKSSTSILHQQDNGKRQKLSSSSSSSSSSHNRRYFDSIKILFLDIPPPPNKRRRGNSIASADNKKMEKIEYFHLPDHVKRLKIGKFTSLNTLFPINRKNNPIGRIIEYSQLRYLDLSMMKITQKSSKLLLNHPLVNKQLIETLILPEEFDCSLMANSLPSSLKELVLGKNFNSPIHFLPESLEILRFDRFFNHPLPPLPAGLIELSLGESFDHPIIDLPHSLKVIQFSRCFNHSIPLGTFPNSIEDIQFGKSFRDLHPDSLPSSVKHLKLHGSVYSMICENLPISLESLTIMIDQERIHPPRQGKWPKSLIALRFENISHDSPFNRDTPIKSVKFFPPYLRSIDLGDYDGQLRPGIFPSTVEEIKLSGFANPVRVGVFPPGLKKIHFTHFSHSLPVGVFPPGIQSIDLSSQYTYPLEIGLFPPGVKELKITTKSPLLPGVFPEGVESIMFYDDFNLPLVLGLFPSSLRRLKFYRYAADFQQEILRGVLPQGLKELDIGNKYRAFLRVNSLPSYFWPDDIDFRGRRLDMKKLPAAARKLLIDSGEEKVAVHPLRVSISPWKYDYFVVYALSGYFPPFIVHRSIIQEEI